MTLHEGTLFGIVVSKDAGRGMRNQSRHELVVNGFASPVGLSSRSTCSCPLVLIGVGVLRMRVGFEALGWVAR